MHFSPLVFPQSYIVLKRERKLAIPMSHMLLFIRLGLRPVVDVYEVHF